MRAEHPGQRYLEALLLHMLHNSLNSGWSVIAATIAVGEVCKISGPKCGRGAAKIKASAVQAESRDVDFDSLGDVGEMNGQRRQQLKADWNTGGLLLGELVRVEISRRSALLTCRNDNAQILAVPL